MPEALLGPLGIIDDAGVLGVMLFLVKQLWVLRSGAQATKGGIKQAVVEEDSVKKPIDPPKLSDGI